ncbi:putative bifunctional diguanylate cyclase/phosphodiesterase [Methylocystis parvus]|uniref:EAL domain-containing protein n=1 Tax=Methylocystis parvus TaxID=134 RepID=A0A6B8MBL3_9HYPH|nr:EAL domain-containing protein [Methylocystis parvus]QGM98703.1 EAL domain-containing protein [Methylocystis parvus]WBK00949.1 EAL domain-containing protein [Methylocystis parvus OBBP]
MRSVKIAEPVDSDAAADDIIQLVRVEKLDMALRLAPLSMGLITFGLLFLGVLFWRSDREDYILLLNFSALILTAVTLTYCKRWFDRPRPDAVAQREMFVIRTVAFLYGSIIGTISPMIYLDGDPQVRLLIATTVAGAIANCITISFLPSLAIAYLVPLVTQSLLTLAATGELFSFYVALLELLFALFLSFLTIFMSALVERRVIAQYNLEREQALTNLLLNDFEESANDWLWETDDELRLRHVSDRLSQVAARDKSALKEKPIAELFAPDGEEGVEAFTRLREAVVARRAFRDILLPVLVEGERRWWLVSGKPIVVGNSRFSGYRGVGADITIKKQAEDRLSFLVMHDALTNLPNRVCFQQRLNKASAELYAKGTPYAVLCLDLDEFKSVNDTLGHGAGDKLLQAVSYRLIKAVGPKAVVARLAGDEYAVLLSGLDAYDREKLSAACASIVSEISVPFPINDAVVNIGVSIGIAIAPQDGVQEIMRRADLALYQAKRNGKNVFRFYQADMDEEIIARRAIGAELQVAVERGEFVLYFQPLVNAASKKIQGFEALVRWKHPTRGFVSPAEFIPIAEEIGAISSLGGWVIDEACRLAVTWPTPVPVAVNISPIQFRHSDLPQIVSDALRRHELPAHRLELELTESALLESTPATQKMLHRLGEIGVRLSLDDFGTGYSSLSYLRRISFHKIKIDQSFVRNLPEDERDMSIVRAIVDIATTMGVATIAEGVETEDQSRALLAQGCHQLQGYLFSKPVPAEDVPLLLAPGSVEMNVNAVA